jgi:fucose 4-O-acetylase-like acetyltransferase
MHTRDHSMTRINHIDILRGIAICFMVFGHVIHVPELRTYIYGFHMPLFFFISGILFKPENYENFKQFFVKKFKALILPYCIFYLITFLYWFLIERRIRGTELSPVNQLLGLFYGKHNIKYSNFNEALWFLPCLFTTESLYFFINHINSKWRKLCTCFACYIVGCILIEQNITWLPWGINAALIACIFYGFGNYFRKEIFRFEKLPRFYYLLIILICGSLQILLLQFTKADLAELKIPNYYLYIPIALIGIIVYLSLSLTLKKNKLLEFIGIISLIIFAFQAPIYRIIIYITSNIFGWEIEFVRNNILICILITIISISLIVPIAFLYNRYIKPVIDKINIMRI